MLKHVFNFDLVKLVVQLIDSRVGPTADDVVMLRFLREAEIPFLVVATKADKLSGAQRGRCIPAICRALAVQPWEVIVYSSKDGTGKDKLLELIEGEVAPAE